MLTKIILIFSLFLLTGCTAKIQELQQKSKDIRSRVSDVDKTAEGENAPAVKDMDLNEIEDELENMDDLDVEADLDEIDKEL